MPVRITTMSGSTPIAVPRWSASWRCRRACSSSARSWSSSGRSRPACGSTWRSLTLFRSVSILPPNSNAPAPRSPPDTRKRPVNNVIAFQGRPGAYSNLACRGAYPEMQTLPCESFEDMFAAVRDGKASLAMVPIENSVAGRVADIHHLMPESGLHIIAEKFQRVNHQLMAVKGSFLKDPTTVRSYVHSLPHFRPQLAGRRHRLV